jgi:hypothetical protein
MRNGFCKTISVSSCPNPPTFGSIFNDSSNLTKSPCLIVKDKPGGTNCEVLVPSELTIVIFDSPFSVVVISEI